MARALPPVVIAGAGIAGLTLALALASRGLRALIVERRGELGEAGAGIQLGPNAMHVLGRLGVADRLEAVAGRPEAIAVADGASGRALAMLPLNPAMHRRFGAPYRVAHRADLQAALLAELIEQPLIELRLGFDVAAWREEAGGVVVVSAAGDTASGSMLIGADGLWSRVRRTLHPAHPLTYAGKMAARTVIATEAAAERFRRPVTGVWLGRDAHVVHYPVRDHREIAVVAIVDEPVAREGWGGAVTGDAVLARLGGFAADLLRFLAVAQEWRAWSLYDPPPLPGWSKGRVALIGDAAHPILPFLAQGGAMAIEDAWTLADALAAAVAGSEGQPGPAFAALEARRPRVARAQSAARRNGRIYHLTGAAGFARNAVMGLAPGSMLMAQYDWLYGWGGPATAP